MKNLIYLICFTFFISCDTNEKKISYNFKIENNSGKDIVITSYNSQNPTVIQRTISIVNESFFIESYTNSERDGGYYMKDLFKGDSIVVSYNNDERKEIFICIYDGNFASGCDEPRNLLNFYDSVPLENSFNTIYKFTSSDYDNAND